MLKELMSLSFDLDKIKIKVNELYSKVGITNYISQYLPDLSSEENVLELNVSLLPKLVQQD